MISYESAGRQPNRDKVACKNAKKGNSVRVAQG